ncbi:MAG TPA: glycoside hydrolase family 57 protein [Burkholderiales bacterium]|nr:glycoside hydrolase family 57 protein [Burkholderiales bacterium]
MANAARPLTLVLLWHMHQPEYRDYATGEFREPWVYLHAIKDYADMAWHLENHPGVRAIVNFTPVLLDQIEDYVDQFARGKLRDPLLRLLVRPDNEALGEAERSFILEHCFRTDDEPVVRRFAAYQHLHELFALLEARGSDSRHHLSDQYFFDLLTWHHLRWAGETVRRSSPVVTRLMAIGTRFSYADRTDLFRLIGELVSGIMPRYAKLAEAGRIELSTTPHFHPMAPLLMSFGVVREAAPEVALPQAPQYPGGYGRVRAQLESALDSHRRRFGIAAGVWPAEGAISPAFVRLLADHGCKWTASGSRVLANSLQGSASPQALYRPYRLEAAGAQLAIFFRDDRLSDLIGFEYAKWNSHDAAANLIAELETIAAGAKEGTPLVSVILDGENCWDSYAYNGYYFLTALYQALESRPSIRTTTYRAHLEETGGAPLQPLPRLVSGTWVQGSFSTWIGSPEKNHAWDLLCTAKQSFDLVIGSERLSETAASAALRQLAACEASDWFWWPGPYNPQHTVECFDRMYRDNLINLYRLLELPAPSALALPISRGGGHPEAGGTMRRAEASS